MFDLQQPRHIPTLPFSAEAASSTAQPFRFTPKAGVSPIRNWLRRADFVVEVAGEPGPDRMSGISRPAAGKNATFTFRN